MLVSASIIVRQNWNEEVCFGALTETKKIPVVVTKDTNGCTNIEERFRSDFMCMH